MKTDKELQHAVEQELLWETSIHPEHIGVSVNNGVVHEREEAERVAWAAPGVSAVKDLISVG